MIIFILMIIIEKKVYGTNVFQNFHVLKLTYKILFNRFIYQFLMNIYAIFTLFSLLSGDNTYFLPSIYIKLLILPELDGNVPNLTSEIGATIDSV